MKNLISLKNQSRFKENEYGMVYKKNKYFANKKKKIQKLYLTNLF